MQPGRLTREWRGGDRLVWRAVVARVGASPTADAGRGQCSDLRQAWRANARSSAL